MNKPNEIELPTTPAQVAETLADGNQLKVFHDDGRSEIVKVRRLPRKSFVEFATLFFESMTNESPECGFYCDRGEDWAEGLSGESFDEIMREGRRLNFSRFIAWTERRIQVMTAAKSQLPQLAQLIEKQLAGLPKPTNS